MDVAETDPGEGLQVNAGLFIPGRELQFSFSRGGGPGGQHVNKTETTVAVTWHPASSIAINEGVRGLLQRNLASRLDSAGWLTVEASNERSQLRNRDEALRKLAQLLREALVEAKPRRATRPTRASKERRLDSKKRDSAKKSLRNGHPAQRW